MIRIDCLKIGLYLFMIEVGFQQLFVGVGIQLLMLCLVEMGSNFLIVGCVEIIEVVEVFLIKG